MPQHLCSDQVLTWGVRKLDRDSLGITGVLIATAWRAAPRLWRLESASVGWLDLVGCQRNAPAADYDAVPPPESLLSTQTALAPSAVTSGALRAEPPVGLIRKDTSFQKNCHTCKSRPRQTGFSAAITSMHSPKGVWVRPFQKRFWLLARSAGPEKGVVCLSWAPCWAWQVH